MYYTGKAIEIAKKAHKGQLYGDRDYFDCHILGVTENVMESRWFKDLSDVGKEIEFILVSLLHDVVEDSDTSLEYLKKIFGTTVSDAVEAISKGKDEEYDCYLERVKGNDIARLVKLEDIRFNLKNVLSDINIGSQNPKLFRLKAKYEKANKFLNIEEKES